MNKLINLIDSALQLAEENVVQVRFWLMRWAIKRQIRRLNIDIDNAMQSVANKKPSVIYMDRIGGRVH